MNNIGDLELNILSCLIQKPELMKQTILEDKYFVKHQRLWQFMKAFYKKFETFDIQLMYSLCKNKFKIINYIEMLVDLEPVISNFNLYQNELIKKHEQHEQEQWIIDKIYSLANDLYVRNINLHDFQDKLNKIYSDSKVIFKKGDEI